MAEIVNGVSVGFSKADRGCQRIEELVVSRISSIDVRAGPKETVCATSEHVRKVVDRVRRPVREVVDPGAYPPDLGEAIRAR